jgi:hypothetical protein
MKVQEAGAEAAAALGTAWHTVTSPFAVFGDAWLLNLLFFTSISLLVYNLLIAAPKQ